MKKNMDEGLRRLGVLVGLLAVIAVEILWFRWALPEIEFGWLDTGEAVAAIVLLLFAAKVGAEMVFSLVMGVFWGVRACDEITVAT